ncbi:dnaJ homolog subfamily C member 21 [Eupeodes corollae]|uniref:dnaJ homolog subfamily C member 21 n=1 Tax=Eupeodes corollae TaxID=290404 RepID=UPI002491ED62|nr:dnaJ homolog subfamily C member 21 [Eupeodes corollae]
MKCYYEELGVARDASDGDIKTAYRKLALRWHPDKNLNNSEEAKERFQTLQQAYEVLSDQHERAWYDNHREQILRGKNSEYEENCLDLFQYFTVSCFKGYGDDNKGFYKTYAEVFEKIAAEDAEFMDDEEEIENIPKFGDSTSSYEDVVGPFYAYWQSYCTKKTYTWLCPHDITGIKDRRVLRYIEKDMKKIVQQAKRERNDEVRNLVSFIRKRDKRVQANKKLLEEKAALNRQKQEQNRLEQIRKRNRELEEMRKANPNVFNEGFEEQLKQLEQEYDKDLDSEEDESDGSLDSDEDKEEVDLIDDLYCVACNKAFTNENAFMNHETSKKHKENIERLVREMKDEEKSFEEEEDTKQQKKVHIVELDDLDELDSDFDGMSDDMDLPSDLEDIDAELLDSELEDELYNLYLDEKEEYEEEEKQGKLEEEKEEIKEPTIVSTKKPKKNKKAKKAPKVDNEAFEEKESEEEVVTKIEDKEEKVDDSDDDWGKGKKTAKKSKNKKAQKKSTATEVQAEHQPTAKEQVKEPKISLNGSVNGNDNANDPSCDTNHNCVTCKATFPSKNKLFAHLKKTNHGVYIPKAKPQATAQTQTTKKSKGKKK